jgi:hypothetical protein
MILQICDVHAELHEDRLVLTCNTTAVLWDAQGDMQADAQLANKV